MIMAALCNRAGHYIFALRCLLSIGSGPSDHYFRSVCPFVCAVFLSRLSSDFDETWTYVICLGLLVSPRI